MAQDPKHAGPTPPQPEQQQKPPGHTAEMTPTPDHGEKSYQGCGKLEDRATIIKAAIPALAGPWRSPSPARAPIS